MPKYQDSHWGKEIVLLLRRKPIFSILRFCEKRNIPDRLKVIESLTLGPKHSIYLGYHEHLKFDKMKHERNVK